jgi:hypothetical protein
VRYNTSGALQSLLENCLTPSLVAALQQQSSSSSSRGGMAPLTSLVAAVASGLGARYQEAWGLALPGMLHVILQPDTCYVCVGAGMHVHGRGRELWVGGRLSVN